MIFTLFIILLHEFNRENFELIFNNEFKLGKLRNVLLDLDPKIYSKRKGRSESLKSYLDFLANNWINQPLIVSNNLLYSFLQGDEDERFFELLLLFTPLDIKANPQRFSREMNRQSLCSWKHSCINFKLRRIEI